MGVIAISEGHGDAALLLLQAGAEHDKKDADGHVAIELAPDAKVCLHSTRASQVRNPTLIDGTQTRKFILQAAEREGIDLE